VRQKIKESQQRFKLYFDKKHKPHNIKTGDWVKVSKKRFKNGFFPNDWKAILNLKYSQPVKVLKVVDGTTTLQANRDFSKDMRININNLRQIHFWDQEAKNTLEHKESGGESVTT
jgi:hypothetical protein